MNTPDPQQPIDVPAPNAETAAAHNSDQATAHPLSKADTPDRASSPQSMVPLPPNTGTTAAPNDHHAISGAHHDGADVAARDGEDGRHAFVAPASPEPIDRARDGADPDSTSWAAPEVAATVAASDRLSSEQQGHMRADPLDTGALLLWDPVLQTLADGLDDVESTRIAQANRHRILTTTKPDEDGVVRGFGLAADHPAVAALNAQLQTLEFLDAQMSKALQKQLRAHPLHPWITAQKGLGDKTVARLLAAVRDPYWNDLHDRPRTVGELFAFCGVAGPGYKRRRGVVVNWNPDARKRLWIIATTIVKVGGPYRATYDAARERYAEKTHTTSCVQCGSKGKPAEPGTEWRDGHKHAGAVRLVMREVLRDLWLQSRAIYDARGKAIAS